MLVCYDDVMFDREGMLEYIGEWLGSDRTEFVDIEKKIGWTCE
jgi:hypothetical protein